MNSIWAENPPRWKVINTPSGDAAWPVTLAEARAHARVDDGVDDARVTGMLRACSERAQTLLGGKCLVQSTFEHYLGGFPCSREIRLPMPPLVSVTKIEYVDAAGTTQTLSASAYLVDVVSEPGRVYLKRDEVWPETECENINAVVITYVAGYTNMPNCIREAVLSGTTYMYAYRGDDPDGMKLQLDQLMEMHLAPEMMLVH